MSMVEFINCIFYLNQESREIKELRKAVAYLTEIVQEQRKEIASWRKSNEEISQENFEERPERDQEEELDEYDYDQLTNRVIE